VVSIGFGECLDRVADFIKFEDRPTVESRGAWYFGKGVSGGNKYMIGGSTYCAHIKLYRDGSLELRQSNDEVGQGCDTVLSQIIAEEFKVPMNKIIVLRGDTRFTPYSEGASGSRVTFMEGNAVIQACNDLKTKMFELAAPKLNLFPDELVTSDGLIYSRIKGSEWGSVAVEELFSLGILDKGGDLMGMGTYTYRITPLDYETGQSERINASYTYCAHAAEVAVNVETGEVKVLKFGAAFDIGRAINPKLCEGQIEGGISMGLGTALWEEVIVENGKVCNPSFKDYHFPVVTQIPTGENTGSFIVEVPHPEGPYGAKGLGEAVICGTGSAIRAAIIDAIGVYFYEMPMIPEKILAAVSERGIKPE
jgi:carbon-monoxide dehydrogenase large subunit